MYSYFKKNTEEFNITAEHNRIMKPYRNNISWNNQLSNFYCRID